MSSDVGAGGSGVGVEHSQSCSMRLFFPLFCDLDLCLRGGTIRYDVLKDLKNKIKRIKADKKSDKRTGIGKAQMFDVQQRTTRTR